MSQLPDNRLRFPSPKIDFINDVGLAGQDHDNYPLPQGQARFDHMRMAIIALLAQQASFSEPTQFREGTPWFDLNFLTLKVRKGNSWVSYAEVIGLTGPDIDGNVLTLAEWYTSVSNTLVSLAPEIVFSGRCAADGISTITIPTSLQASIATDSRIFLFINGSLVDPHNCSLVGTPATSIKLSGVVLNDGDTFIVSIRRISATTYLQTTIVVP